jgi:hypothetical protein
MKKFPKTLAFFILALVAGIYMVLSFLHNLAASVPPNA